MKNNQHEASQIIKKLLDDIVVKQDAQAIKIKQLEEQIQELYNKPNVNFKMPLLLPITNN